MPLYVKTIEKQYEHPVDDSRTVNLANGAYIQLDASRLIIDSSANASPWNLIKTYAQEFYMRSDFEALLNHTITCDGLMVRFPCAIFLLGEKCYISALGTQISGSASVFPTEAWVPSGLLTSFDEVDPDQFVAWDRFFITVPFRNNGATYVFAHELTCHRAIETDQNRGKWCRFYNDPLRLDLPFRNSSGVLDWNTYYAEDIPPYRTPVIPVLDGFPAFYLYPTKMDNLDYGSSLRYVMPGLTRSLTERDRQQVFLDPYKGVIPIDTYDSVVGVLNA